MCSEMKGSSFTLASCWVAVHSASLQSAAPHLILHADLPCLFSLFASLWCLVFLGSMVLTSEFRYHSHEAGSPCFYFWLTLAKSEQSEMGFPLNSILIWRFVVSFWRPSANAVDCGWGFMSTVAFCLWCATCFLVLCTLWVQLFLPGPVRSMFHLLFPQKLLIATVTLMYPSHSNPPLLVADVDRLIALSQPFCPWLKLLCCPVP